MAFGQFLGLFPACGQVGLGCAVKLELAMLEVPKNKWPLRLHRSYIEKQRHLHIEALEGA